MSRFLIGFQNDILGLKEVGSAEAQMLSWQHTSYLSLNFVRNIWGFDSSIC